MENNITDKLSFEELMKELKDKRIEQSITIEDLTKELLLASGKIQKLERGEPFGNNSYIRMILKKYITALGLDYSLYDQKIKELFPSMVEKTIVLNELEPKKLKEMKKTKNGKEIKRRVSYLIFILFIIFLLIISFYNIKLSVNNNQTINETTLLEETVLKPETVIEKPKPDVEVKIDDNNIEVYLKKDKDVKVEIETTDLVYLDYSLDDVIQAQGTIVADQNIEYNFDDINDLEINVGAIENVKVTINDKNITSSLKGLKGQKTIVLKKQES